MKEDELAVYERLTKFQKDLVDALKELGFKYNYFTIYECIGWGVIIDVSKFHNWSKVIVHLQRQLQSS